MKRLLNLRLLIIFMVFSAGVSFAQEKKAGKAIIKTNIYCSHCQVCETCGQNFKAHMLKIPGVRMYELDDKAMTITVYFNEKKTSLEKIKAEISKLGFDADDVKADALAYEKLDNCCKKQED